MKILTHKNLTNWSLIIAFVLTSLIATAQTKAHPYLYFTPGPIKDLKERLPSDTLFTRIWGAMKGKADAAVKTGQGGNIEELSLAYRMTGDTTYAAQAKMLLLDLVKRKEWDGLDDRTPRWNSALGTARNMGLTALAFDALYDYLSSDERKFIANRIVELGIKPALGDWINDGTRIHTMNSMGHNWWSAVVFQAGVASLSVMKEIPEAKMWAEEVMRASSDWFAFSGSVLENKPSTFDPDGGFYESVGYANFGVSEYLFFRLAWTNAFSAIKMPYDGILEKTMDWFINAGYPNTGEFVSLNFGDSNPYANGDRPIKLMIALGFDKPRYHWYLSKTSAATGSFREDLKISTALGLVYTPKINEVTKKPDLPFSALYSNMGWAMMRSSWDRNASLLAVKSGYTWNHAHADAGSFILYHRGKDILVDAGHTGYGAPEYSSYFVTSQAHNVVLFNGKAQSPQDQYHGVKQPGHLYNLIDAGSFKYLLADATGPTSQHLLRNYRSFLWIGKVILVIDDLKAYETGQWEWLLHFKEKAVKKGIDLDITHGDANVLVRPLFPETLPNGYPHDFPEKMKLQLRSGIDGHDAKIKVPYYSISPALQYQQTKFLNAIILLDDSNKEFKEEQLSAMASAPEGRINLPRIDKLEGKDYIGVRVTQDGKITEVYFNLLADGRLMHRNSLNVMNGWETDAYIMAVTYAVNSESTPENARSYFISNGSYLKKGNHSVFSSLSKVFMHVDAEKATPEILLQGQPLIHVNLKLTKRFSQVILNSKTVKGTYKGDIMVLDVNGYSATH